MKQETNTNQANTQQENSTHESTQQVSSKHVANISIIYFVAFLILLISFVCFGQENASKNSELKLKALTLKDGSENQPFFTVDLTKAQANYKKEALRYILKRGVLYESKNVKSFGNETLHISQIAKFNINNSVSGLYGTQTHQGRFNPHANITFTLVKINF